MTTMRSISLKFRDRTASGIVCYLCAATNFARFIFRGLYLGNYVEAESLRWFFIDDRFRSGIGTISQGYNSRR